MIGADPTGAFDGVQAIVVGIVVLAAAGTVGLSVLGLPAGLSGLAFVLLFAALMALSWTRIEDVQPRHDRTDGE